MLSFFRSVFLLQSAIRRMTRAKFGLNGATEVTAVTLLTQHVVTVVGSVGHGGDDDDLLRSTEELLATFDLPSCCFVYDGKQ